MPRGAMIVLVAGCLLVGCGSGDSDTPGPSPQTPEAISAPEPPSIVGRWEVRRTCDGMVEALEQAGLRALAPSLVGDYFPDQSPKQLAQKTDICQGAKPQEHSHFFTDDGHFGSLDQHEQQVDEQRYDVIDDRTLRLSTEFGEEPYRYRIAGGDELTLEPVISAAAKREALANPLEFGAAAHSVAVAYAGHTWKRAECAGWC